jgi:hypothetical protein
MARNAKKVDSDDDVDVPPPKGTKQFSRTSGAGLGAGRESKNNSATKGKKYLEKGKGRCGGKGSTTPITKEDDEKDDLEEEAPSAKKVLRKKKSTRPAQDEIEDNDECEWDKIRRESAKKGHDDHDEEENYEEKAYTPANYLNDDVAFDDYDEWKPTNVKKPENKKKTSLSKGSEIFQTSMHAKDLDEDHEEEPMKGQTSALVDKYFKKGHQPSRESKKVAAEEPPSNVALPELSKEQEEVIVKRYVAEKIEALNGEIAKFKLENERVGNLRKKHEEMLKQLNKEVETFKKKREDEVAEFEEWKAEEVRRMQREKKIAERNSKAMANMPNRKDREEITALKEQIKKLTDDGKMKDQRNKLTIDRLRKQLEEATTKCDELQAEIKRLEQARLNGGTTKSSIPTSVKTVENLQTTDQKPPLSKTGGLSQYVSNKKPVEEPPIKAKTMAQSQIGLKKKLAEEEEEEEPGQDDDAEYLGSGDEQVSQEDPEENDPANDEDDEFATYEAIVNKDYKKTTTKSPIKVKDLIPSKKNVVQSKIPDDDEEDEPPVSRLGTNNQKKSTTTKVEPVRTSVNQAKGPLTKVQPSAEAVTKSKSPIQSSKAVPPPKPNAKAESMPRSQAKQQNNFIEEPEEDEEEEGGEAERDADEGLKSDHKIGIASMQRDNDFKYSANDHYRGYAQKKGSVVKVLSQNVSSDGKVSQL